MNFNLYSYKYNCPRWYGNVEGFQQIHVNKETNDNDAEQLAIKKANITSGSTSCNIHFLNKFDVAINSVETYPSLTGIDLKMKNV